MKSRYPVFDNFLPLWRFFALSVFASIPSAWARAQPAESIFSRLSRSGQLIELTLRTDMDELINNRRREEYQPAELYVTEKKGVETQWEVEAVPRGNYRRRICTFPPLRLNFAKSQLEERGLNPEYDKMKVVTHCLEGKEGKDCVLKEYLAYKLYNQLNPKSYRVQLARITYLDTKGKYKKIKNYSILIEETDELAHRLGGVEFEGLNQPPESFATAEENLLSVFQYMIGNDDWDFVMLRNVKLIRPDDGGGLIPVPYDFDFSGLVNAPYAVPNAKYGLSNVRQRVFMGHAAEEEQLQKTLEHFRRYHLHLRTIIKNFRLLSLAERTKAIKYIDSFYENEEALIRENAQKLKAREEGDTQDEKGQ